MPAIFGVHGSGGASGRPPRRTSSLRIAPGATPRNAEHDDFFDVDVPFPLPTVGMKVVVHGRYGFATQFGGQVVREPVAGVVRYAPMMMLSPAQAGVVWRGRTVSECAALRGQRSISR